MIVECDDRTFGVVAWDGERSVGSLVLERR